MKKPNFKTQYSSIKFKNAHQIATVSEADFEGRVQKEMPGNEDDTFLFKRRQV